MIWEARFHHCQSTSFEEWGILCTVIHGPGRHSGSLCPSVVIVEDLDLPGATAWTCKCTACPQCPMCMHILGAASNVHFDHPNVNTDVLNSCKVVIGRVAVVCMSHTT